MTNESPKVTFDDAQKYFFSQMVKKRIDIHDPVKFLQVEIAQVESNLERIRSGKETLEDVMDPDKDLPSLQNQLALLKAYLDCFERPKVRIGRPETINTALLCYEAQRKPGDPETASIRAALEELQQVKDGVFQGYKDRFDKEYLKSSPRPPMPHLCEVFTRVSQAIENPGTDFPELSPEELAMLRMATAYYIQVIVC